MRKFWLLFAQSTTIALGILFVFRVFSPPSPVPSPTPAIINRTEQQIPQISFRTAAELARPSVVNIFTSKKSPHIPFFRDPAGKPDNFSNPPNHLGSGVIVSADGYILTNQHVVEAADEIQVMLHDGRTLSAKLVGSDPETDLAVLKINASQLPSIIFAPSDRTAIGDVALAIGNPFGVGQTVTMGIISALGRSHLGINTFEDFIQTDAAINPGNSGGALVNTDGHLIGINSAIYSRTGGSQGIGFAIPSNLAANIMQQIIAHGEVVRGWIGVEVQDITPELAESYQLNNTNGALISGILQHGPADLAGIHPGDIILSANNKPIKDSLTLLELVAALKPGTAIQFNLLHKDKTATTTVKIARRPKIQ
jgi:serine protease DegQ